MRCCTWNVSGRIFALRRQDPSHRKSIRTQHVSEKMRKKCYCNTFYTRINAKELIANTNWRLWADCSIGMLLCGWKQMLCITTVPRKQPSSEILLFIQKVIVEPKSVTPPLPRPRSVLGKCVSPCQYNITFFITKSWGGVSVNSFMGEMNCKIRQLALPDLLWGITVLGILIYLIWARKFDSSKIVLKSYTCIEFEILKDTAKHQSFFSLLSPTSYFRWQKIWA